MGHPRTYQLRLHSERGNIALVEPFLRSIVELDRLGPHRYHDALVALTEAVNNAIIHGNDCDPAKIVTVNVQTTDGDVVFLIGDSGHGFDPASVPDPRDPENILREGGRGVFLIRHLADVVEFYPTSDGTTVLVKYFFPV